MKVNTPLVGASWAAPTIVTPPLSRSTLHLLPHSVTCDGCAQYLHCLHAGVWWCRRGNRGCADPCCQYSLFTVSYISCGTVLMKHSGEGISSCFAFFFFFLRGITLTRQNTCGLKRVCRTCWHCSATESQFCENWRFTWEQKLHYRLEIVWRGPHAVWCVRRDSISAWGDTEAVCFFVGFFPPCLCNPHAKRWAMCCIFARRFVVNVEAHTWTHHSVTISSRIQFSWT